jgi:hypothetical protein
VYIHNIYVYMIHNQVDTRCCPQLASLVWFSSLNVGFMVEIYMYRKMYIFTIYHVYIHTYIIIYIYISIYIYLHIHIYIYVYIYTYPYIYISIYRYIHIYISFSILAFFHMFMNWPSYIHVHPMYIPNEIHNFSVVTIPMTPPEGRCSLRSIRTPSYGGTFEKFIYCCWYIEKSP